MFIRLMLNSKKTKVCLRLTEIETMSKIEEKVNVKLKKHCFGTQANKRRLIEHLQV